MNGTISTAIQEPHRRLGSLKQLRHTIGVVTGLLVTAVGLLAAAPSAFAMTLQPPAGNVAGPTATVTAAHTGMLGWQITLIAVGAAVVSAFVTAFLLHLGSGRRIGPAAS